MMECTPESVNCELCDPNYQNGAVSNQLTNGGRGGGGRVRWGVTMNLLMCRRRCTLFCKPHSPIISLQISATYGAQVLLYIFFASKRMKRNSNRKWEPFCFRFEWSSEKKTFFSLFFLLVRLQIFVLVLSKIKNIMFSVFIFIHIFHFA